MDFQPAPEEQAYRQEVRGFLGNSTDGASTFDGASTLAAGVVNGLRAEV